MAVGNLKSTKSEAQGLIRIIGSIDTASYAQFTEELSRYESKSAKTLHIELFSEGGDEYAALAFAARIRRSSCRFICTVFGQAASASVLILMSCQQRRMTKESWIMCHESREDEDHITRTKAVSMAKHMERMEQQWASLCNDGAAIVEPSWAELHQSEDRYMSAAECLDLGIIHKVV